MTPQVTAEVILRTRGGESLVDAGEPPTSENIDRYKVEDDVASEATKKLNELSIKVLQTGPVSLSISAEKEVFERVFQTRLGEVGGPGLGETGSARYEAVAPIQVPRDLASLVAEVVLPIPPIFYP